MSASSHTKTSAVAISAALSPFVGPSAGATIWRHCASVSLMLLMVFMASPTALRTALTRLLSRSGGENSFVRRRVFVPCRSPVGCRLQPLAAVAVLSSVSVTPSVRPDGRHIRLSRCSVSAQRTRFPPRRLSYKSRLASPAYRCCADC